MIYVTQGHENGIGLEIFFKSFLCLSKNDQKKITLITSKASLSLTLDRCFLSYQIKDQCIHINSIELKCLFFNTKQNEYQSSLALEIALKRLKYDDILITLPTSKDQLFYKDIQVNGHTEFFRKHFLKKEIAMCFLAPDTNFLLLSDHISINKVSSYLTSQFIFDKVSLTLTQLSKIRPIKEVFFSGINPHCGENGHISTTDRVVTYSISELKTHFQDIKFYDMLPADTIHFNLKDKSQLFIYAYHDQGLAPFKLRYGLTGINLSLGMDFKRVSVDHGTAFDLFGKDTANYIGMLNLFDEVLSWT